MDDTAAVEDEHAEHDDVPADLIELHQILEWERATVEGPESVAEEGYGR